MSFDFDLEEVLAKTRTIFKSKLPERLSAIEFALNTNDREKMSSALHELKGAAVYFEGFEHIVKSSELLENDIWRKDSKVVIEAHFRELKKVSHRLLNS